MPLLPGLVFFGNNSQSRKKLKDKLVILEGRVLFLEEKVNSLCSQLDDARKLNEQPSPSMTLVRSDSETTEELAASIVRDGSSVVLEDKDVPEVKPDKKAVALRQRAANTLVGRNLQVSSLPLPSPPADMVLTSRGLLNHLRGVSPSAMFSLAERVLFPNYHPKLYPLAPTVPGESGYLFTTRKALLVAGEWDVFLKKPVNGSLTYAGKYRSSWERKMTGEEFADLEDVVKDAWGEEISQSKDLDYYLMMRARITFRNFNEGRDPTEEELADQVAGIKESRGNHIIGVQAVRIALESGQEALDIVKLEFANEYTSPEILFEDKSNTNSPNGKQGPRRPRHSTEPSGSPSPKSRIRNRRVASSGNLMS